MRQLTEDFARSIALGVLREAWSAAQPETWRRRAAQFRAVAPRSGDFTGDATDLELAAIRRRSEKKAHLAELHARLLESGYFDDVHAEMPHDVVPYPFDECPTCHGTGEVPAGLVPSWPPKLSQKEAA